MDVVEVTPKPFRGVGLVAAGLVAGLVIAGLTTADAGTAPPPPVAAAPSAGPGERGERHGEHGERHGPRGGRLGRLGAVAHGEFVLRQRDGSFRTMAVQRGVATALTATAVTVRSADGYTRTYARDAETKVADGLKAGSFVRVLAVVQGGTARATHVRPGRMRDRPGGA